MSKKKKEEVQTETEIKEEEHSSKSEVLHRLHKKKKNSIPNPENILNEIKANSESKDEVQLAKENVESALRLADDETIELKVIKKVEADSEKRKKVFKFFRFKKKEQVIKPKMDLSKATRYIPDVDVGLTEEQISERIKDGYTNESKTSYTKSIGRIFVDNIFTFFNMLLTIIAIALVCVGSYTNLFFMVIALINTGFGIFQEIRAKITMDKLRLVTVPTTNVLRNGQTSTIPTEQIVLDDIMLLSIGNQIPSDGVVKKGMIEVNESLLTGESLPIKKNIGDTVYAGSFVVSGSAAVQVEHIADTNYSSSIQNMAKQYTKPKSELVRALNTIIHSISFVVIPLGAILFCLNFFNSGDIPLFNKVKEAIEATAGSLIGMIPAGMYLLTTFALMAGVLRISKRRTVVRELYCIEMLARVNVLCLDKTGTLTDGTMNVNEVVVIDDTYDVPEVMGSYLSVFEDNNQTSIALQQAFSYNSKYRVIDKIPFSSSRKYSAISFENIGTFLLGAPEFVCNNIDDTLQHLIAEKQSKGFRVLLFGHTNAIIKNEKISGVVRPVAIFILMDHIRPEAPATIKWFNDNDVEIKIISGDSPLTASEIAASCGVINASNWVSLEGLSINEVTEIADKYTVFGRVSPEQKAALIKALKNRQKVVGMTGDGVNDILAMKSSDCSIAMASGADAAKSVAHLVLLDSNFASMPKVVEEGRRVINNIQRSSSLFLMKTLFTIALTIFVIISNLFGSKMTYPFAPKNLMILEVFCIGVPSAILALQPNKNRIHGHFLRNVLLSSLPGAILLLVAVALSMIPGNYGFYESTITAESLRTMSIICMVICGLAILYQLCKPLDLYRSILVITMCICATLSIFILPENFIGIDYTLLNKIQWLMVCIIGFSSIPLAAGLDSISNKLKNN
ncbi:MAG TPA: ATPase P [Firmicutes bacterium]|nr:ATPase P [Bacillota bacterium]